MSEEKQRGERECWKVQVKLGYRVRQGKSRFPEFGNDTRPDQTLIGNGGNRYHQPHRTATESGVKIACDLEHLHLSIRSALSQKSKVGKQQEKSRENAKSGRGFLFVICPIK